MPAGRPTQGALFDRSAATRRNIFLSKADAPQDDTFLKGLLQRNREVAQARVQEISTALSDLGYAVGNNVEPMARQGTFHLVHQIRIDDGEKRIARSPAPGLFFRDPGLEADSRSALWLKANSLPYVETTILPASEPAPYEIQLSQPASGQCLADMKDERLDRPDLLECLGRAIKGLHGIAGTGAGLLDVDSGVTKDRPSGVHESWARHVFQGLDRHIEICRQVRAMTADEEIRARRRLDDIKPLLAGRPMRFLHGDTNNDNLFLRDDGEVVMIDWDDAMVGDPLYDVAMWATFHPPRRHQAFFTGYGISGDLRDVYGRLFAAYFLRISLAKTVHRHRFGRIDKPGRAPAADRIRWGLEALERAINGESVSIVP